MEEEEAQGQRAVFRPKAIMKYPVDLIFNALGNEIPQDHAYQLYGAVANLLPVVHSDALPLAIAPISGRPTGAGRLQLTARSWLRMRLPAEQIPVLLPLSGKSLTVGGHYVRLSVPRVQGISPSSSLAARLVTIKLADRSTWPAAFLDGFRRRLDLMGIHANPELPLIASGKRTGEPRRGVLRIKDRRIVGYSVIVTGLSAEDSVRLQGQTDLATAFSRRKLGCAFFFPYPTEKS